MTDVFEREKIILSAVIPVKNIKKHQSNLELIVRQAIKNKIKLVIVNDFTNEEDQKIYQTLKRIYHHKDLILWINEKSDNPGSSRNIGLMKVQTKWVAFWDVDDLPNVSIIKKVIQEIEEEKVSADLIIGQYLLDDLTLEEKKELSNDHNLYDVGLNPGLWRMVIKREIINKKFKTFKLAEDQLFLSDLCLERRKIIFSEAFFYTYRKGVQGALTKSIDRLEDLLNSAILTFENIKSEKSIFSAILFCKQIISFIKRAKIRNWYKLLTMLPSFWTRSSPTTFLKLFQAFYFIMRSRMIREK